MPESLTTQGAIKSLRQATPGGDYIAGVFALIAVLIAVGLLRNPPTTLGLLVSIIFILVFGVPAYVLFSSSRSTGVFVTDDRVEFRLLGQVRQAWSRADVGAIEAMSGGLRVLAPDGRLLRQFKFRWWSTELVTRFATATGLAAATAVTPLSVAMAQAAAEAKAEREAAASAADVDPGKAGDT